VKFVSTLTIYFGRKARCLYSVTLQQVNQTPADPPHTIRYMEIRNKKENFWCLEHGVSSQSGNGSWDIGGSDERHDGDHGKTSIVQFSVLLNLHCDFVNTGEIDRGEDNSWKSSTLGVMGSLGLSDDLSKEDGSNDLLLS
jgi:hypothetical protein